MINPNEIKRGNYILYLNDLYVVTGMKEEGKERRLRILFSTIDRSVQNAKIIDYLEPIKLTEEIMDCSGFKMTEGRLLSNRQLDMIGWIGGCYAWHNWNALGNKNVIVTLEFVHQIQNLYSALSNGRELKINLPLANANSKLQTPNSKL